MRPAKLNYGELKFRDQSINGSVLLRRNLSEWTAVMRGGLYADRLIEDWRRYSIRMGYITDAHPGAYCLVSVLAPVNRSAKCSSSEEPGERQCHQKEQQ